MRPISFKRKILLLTTGVALGIMLCSVFVIDISYRNEFRRSLYETLQLHIYSILSATETNGNSLYVPDIFSNPKLNTLDSGLWAVILDENKRVIWQSLSIDAVPNDIVLSQDVGDWTFNAIDFQGETVLTADYYIAWSSHGTSHRYHFISAENLSVLDDVISRARVWLFGSFAVITIVLLICLIMIIKRTLRPINQLEAEIALLESGKKSALSSNYPIELEGVTRNLNALIEKEHNQRERYRSGMADLAHSLKTPMAIINNELKKLPHNTVIKNAIQRIDQSIEYQLRRAVVSGHTVLNRGVFIQDVLDLVLEALVKLYNEKEIVIDHTVQRDLLFIGDENDLMEIFGNLLDNAYKYAYRQIHVTVSEHNQQLIFIIEDDGKGLCESDKNNIFHRGERLDQQNLGQGIGLAVVYDIVKSYQGMIESSSSHLGGALFKIIIPLEGASI